MNTRHFLMVFSMFLPMTSYPANLDSSNETAHISIDSIEEPEKIYIETSQLSFEGHHMFACIKGEWIAIRALYWDEDGLYIHNYPYTRWICRGCGFNNYGGDTTCQRKDQMTGKKCGYPRPE